MPSLLSNITSFFTSKLNSKSRNFYQGAARTNANKDFNNAGDSTFEQTAAIDRPLLRARARWMSANSPLMNNIDESIINLAIGTGCKIQMRTDDDDLNTFIEESFNRWAKKNDWYQDQRVMLKSRMVDGEVFIYARPKADGLEYQLIEADALDDAFNDKGIIRDKEGKPTHYRFKTSDPQDSYNYNYSYDTILVPAEYIYHYFKKIRPTQHRGISEYSSAMQITKNLDAFNQSTVQAARARASIAYVVQADGDIAGLNIDNDNSSDKAIEYIGDVAVHYLKRGESISKTSPASSDTEFSQFNKTTLKQICTARCISYELGVSDASETNYSSFRAALQKDYKRIASDQALQEPIHDWIFEMWMEIEILAGRLKIPYAKFKNAPWEYTKKLYVYPEVITVDPLKERLAEVQAVKLNRTTYSMLAHNAGVDFEEVIKQKAAELAILEEYGLAMDPATGDIGNKSNIDESVSEDVMSMAMEE